MMQYKPIIKIEKMCISEMGYSELIKLMEEGHDIIGETKEGQYFGVLNVNNNCTIIINDVKYEIPYKQLSDILINLKLYKNMTYKELLDTENILIYEIY